MGLPDTDVRRRSAGAGPGADNHARVRLHRRSAADLRIAAGDWKPGLDDPHGPPSGSGDGLRYL